MDVEQESSCSTVFTMDAIKLDIDIFEKLNALELKSHHHKGFVLGYMCAVQIAWMNGDYYKKQLRQSDILESIGFSGANPSFSYLIKKGGILENEGFISRVKDFPVKKWKMNKKPFLFSELSPEKQKQFIKKVSPTFSATEPTYLFSDEEGDSLIERKRDFILITKKEFVECISTGGVNLLMFFLFVKISQFKSGHKKVGITHGNIREHMKFSPPKITELIKLLQNGSLVHLTRATHQNKKGMTYRTNMFSVFSLMDKGDITKLMNQPKENEGWG